MSVELSTICPALARALADRQFENLTPVQTAVLGEDARGRDLLVSAQTGSGKTVAFGLAIGETLLAGVETLGDASTPLALIVAPTRELALQVHRELSWLYEHAGARIVSCVGGMDPRREQRALEAGAHIVVGTPGRLRDHLERGRLDVTGLRALVLDEADEMLDLGFREDLEFIIESTPDSRRSLLFSATLPRPILGLAKRYQRDALRLEIGTPEGGHADIDYRAMRVMPREIEHVVVNVLRHYDARTAIVFCNTRDAVRRLQAVLQERGFTAVALSGELGQAERNHALQSLRDGRAQVCVATDVAARGIDLPDLNLVVHADLPHDAESLQHRSGRTGRAGRKGTSVLLVPNSQRRRAETLFYHAKVQPTWEAPPSAEMIRQADYQRMLVDPLLSEQLADDELQTAAALLERYPADVLAAHFARLYRAQKPMPEEVTDPGEYRRPREQVRATGFAAENGSWFRVRVGRTGNVDPKWLLPMLCKRGGITCRDIGAIRIFESETAVEISAAAAEHFARNASTNVKGEPQIEPMGEAPAGNGQHRPQRNFRPDRGERPQRGSGPKPRADKSSRPGKPHGAAGGPGAKKKRFGAEHDDAPRRRHAAVAPAAR